MIVVTVVVVVVVVVVMVVDYDLILWFMIIFVAIIGNPFLSHDVTLEKE